MPSTASHFSFVRPSTSPRYKVKVNDLFGGFTALSLVSDVTFLYPICVPDLKSPGVPLSSAPQHQNATALQGDGAPATGQRTIDSFLNDTFIPEDWEQALAPSSADKCRSAVCNALQTLAAAHPVHPVGPADPVREPMREEKPIMID